MKILLVNTNRMKPAIAPIGLDYLADTLVAAGHEPRLLDLCFSEDVEADIESAVRDFDPRVIGVTVRNTDECYMSGAFFLPFVKEVVDCLRTHTDAPIVMGGVGFSVIPDAVMGFCRPDYGIAGEGEESFVRLLLALQTRTEIDLVPNLLYWQGAAMLRWNLPHTITRTITLAPAPSWTTPDTSARAGRPASRPNAGVT